MTPVVYPSSDYDVFDELAWDSVLTVVFIVVGGNVELLRVTSSSILGISSGIRNGFETTSSWIC
jgi:hypothetical protein